MMSSLVFVIINAVLVILTITCSITDIMFLLLIILVNIITYSAVKNLTKNKFMHQQQGLQCDEFIELGVIDSFIDELEEGKSLKLYTISEETNIGFWVHNKKSKKRDLLLAVNKLGQGILINTLVTELKKDGQDLIFFKNHVKLDLF